MDTAFIIGNGESRNIFPIETLKGHGPIYGCNAIYRDHPYLCDHVVAVNFPMYEEIVANVAIANRKIDRENDKNGPINFNLIGPNDISKWDFLCDGDDHSRDLEPHPLSIYRQWHGGNTKTGKFRTLDFSKSRGSGCSAVVMAAESGVKNVVILAFDIIGAKQWEYTGTRAGETSREQNNIYKNTLNYPTRMGMKAYLKYEWLYQLRQIFRKFPNTNFYFMNRKEYISGNGFLPSYFDKENIKCGTYADLQRWISNERDQIKWISF